MTKFVTEYSQICNSLRLKVFVNPKKTSITIKVINVLLILKAVINQIYFYSSFSRDYLSVCIIRYKNATNCARVTGSSGLK